MYYRVAIQLDPSALWQWKSTALSSLNTLIQFLRLYQALPQDRLRVFSSPSREEMHEQLVRENQGLPSTSVTAAQFLRERKIERTASTAVASEHSLKESSRREHILEEKRISTLEQRREELERGAGGDYDIPYRFTLPTSIPQVLAWMKLLARVRDGELQP